MTKHALFTWLAIGVLALPAPPLGKPPAPFSPVRDARFRHATAALETLVADRMASGPQRFCIVAYPQREGAVAWVHWATARRLILWEPSSDDDRRFDLARSRRDLDLTQDVRATSEEVGTSTYLVTQGWVDRTIRDCARTGRTYRINRR